MRRQLIPQAAEGARLGLGGLLAQAFDLALQAVDLVLLAHGMGLQAWRSVRSDTQLGIVLNPELCDAASDLPQDVAAARMAELRTQTGSLYTFLAAQAPTLLAQLQATSYLAV